jgi:DNA transformation protein and related proteins
VAPDDIRELFREFGPVEVRRLFGGAGIFADGLMLALVSDGLIYLKTDEPNAPAFEREQLEPFTYATSKGRRGVMSYRRMPDRLCDDPDELAAWARDALAAARRSGTGNRGGAENQHASPKGLRRDRDGSGLDADGAQQEGGQVSVRAIVGARRLHDRLHRTARPHVLEPCDGRRRLIVRGRRFVVSVSAA